MDPTAEELHYTRHFAAENNWKRNAPWSPPSAASAARGKLSSTTTSGIQKALRLDHTRPGSPMSGAKAACCVASIKAWTLIPGAYQTSAHRGTFASASTYHSPPTSQLMVSQMD